MSGCRNDGSLSSEKGVHVQAHFRSVKMPRKQRDSSQIISLQCKSLCGMACDCSFLW